MPTNYAHWAFSMKDKVTILSYAIAGGMAVGWLFYDSLLLGIVLSFFLLFTAGIYRRRCVDKRKRQLLLQFRDLLYAVSSSLSVGRSMTQALNEAVDFWAGVYTEEDDMIRELRYMTGQMAQSNAKDIDVLRDFAERSGLADVTDFVTVYESCKTSGGNMVQAISRATTVIGDKIALEKEMHTLMAQKQFEGRIVMAAPFAVMLFLRVVSPAYLAPLTASMEGYLITTLALTCIVAAWIMTERMNRIAW